MSWRVMANQFRGLGANRIRQRGRSCAQYFALLGERFLRLWGRFARQIKRIMEGVEMRNLSQALHLSVCGLVDSVFVLVILPSGSNTRKRKFLAMGPLLEARFPPFKTAIANHYYSRISLQGGMKEEKHHPSIYTFFRGTKKSPVAIV